MCVCNSIYQILYIYKYTYIGINVYPVKRISKPVSEDSQNNVMLNTFYDFVIYNNV